MNEKGYKNLEQFYRDKHSLFKQWKAGMLNEDTYRGKIYKIKDYAYHEIKEWKCPSCLEIMEFHPGDMVAELRCDCGKMYNRNFILNLTVQVRREIRRSCLAQKSYRRAQYEVNSINVHEKDIPTRVSSKVLHKNQKSMLDY